MLFQPLQTHQAEHLPQLPLACLPVLFPAQTAEDVLQHGHVGKEGVILKQVAHPPFLSGEIDVFFGVEQHPAVQLDVALVRALDAGDAFEGHALAAAGGAEKAGDAVFRPEGRVQRKAAEIPVDIHDQTHLFTAFFCLASRRFTVSSTTVLMARLTITQKKAPASSSVRQSW